MSGPGSSPCSPAWLCGASCWSASRRVHAGRLHGPLLAVIALIPLAAFEMVTGCRPPLRSLQRVRQSAARVFDVMDAAPAVTEPEAAGSASPASATSSSPPGAAGPVRA